MTRHYYHENEAELRRAVDAIPSLDAMCHFRKIASMTTTGATGRTQTIQERLKVLEELLLSKSISHGEYKGQRARILSEL